jgi:hypothetical protein
MCAGGIVTIPSKLNYSRHTYIYSNPEVCPFLCDRCGLRFTSEKRKFNHRRSGRCKTFVCTKCNETFSQHKLLTNHAKYCTAQVINTVDIDNAALQFEPQIIDIEGLEIVVHVTD